MLETGLEAIAFNINRRNSNLKFFEFGKSYHQKETGKYSEKEHLSIYITGADHEDVWNKKSNNSDIYQAKGIVSAILTLTGLSDAKIEKPEGSTVIEISHSKNKLATIQQVSKKRFLQFDIKQNVFFIDFSFETLLKLFERNKITYREISKYPAVTRDLAMVVNSSTTYEALESTVKKLKLSKLQDIRLFDVFESEKLGKDKKSMAMSFTFLDEEKTMTDKEIDSMVNKLIQSFEKELGAEIRK
jgi:phenylalanyl-tRNA synthetase beta chain